MKYEKEAKSLGLMKTLKKFLYLLLCVRMYLKYLESGFSRLLVLSQFSIACRKRSSILKICRIKLEEFLVDLKKMFMDCFII